MMLFRFTTMSVGLWLFLWSILTQASTSYPVEVRRVLDGDTVDVTAHLWPGLRKDIRVRIDGVDTPEIHTRCDYEKAVGYVAKSYVEEWVHGADLTLVNVRYGKYAGRVLGDLQKDNVLLSQALLREGLAVPYLGGTKQKRQCTEEAWTIPLKPLRWSNSN